MSTPRFIADTHLGHRNIYKYRKVFDSTKHNDLYFIRILQETCKKRDTMFFLGDICFDKQYLEIIKELPGQKILIPGNHCTEYIPMKELVDVYDEVHALLKYKEFWLSHAPIADVELRGKRNIHGHVHAQSVPDIKYLNTSVDSEFMRFLPRTLHEVRQAFETMEQLGSHYGGLEDRDDALEVIMSNPISKAAYEWSKKEAEKIMVFQ
ncbi:putative serine/threonine protein phosphatase [Salmonella phage SE_PL]|uniref:hypothetical protein n=1 Tax=Salmonella enterica TaxID=28901 RepID=UPI000FDF782B|nr:phosphoesterase [Salmonella phage Munch]EAZ2023076.1 hypothetical protein [Salmonella enterica]ECV9083722.1 hypothetical protein [Salmonella enterica subsp. enterica serovar Infantis]MCP0435687.1 metallophosphoesterase [Salmonella enterica subsp. enterica serovar Mbandaka]QCW18989.1 putative phosphoesterase or phosphohydrolase [Salmonella phage 7t3]QIG62747.1 putative serine/threonine protein phosphatase [Salmonella phage SE_PL]